VCLIKTHKTSIPYKTIFSLFSLLPNFTAPQTKPLLKDSLLTSRETAKQRTEMASKAQPVPKKVFSYAEKAKKATEKAYTDSQI